MGNFDEALTKFNQRKKSTEKSARENEAIINKLERKLFIYVLKYENGVLKRKELEDFCRLLVVYCKLTRHADVSLSTPDVSFCSFDKAYVHAEYYTDNNVILVNESFLDMILKNKNKLAMLIDAIGHEMEHYYQNSVLIEYENMPAEEQLVMDERKKSLASSLKKDFQLKMNDVKFLHKLLAPYLANGEIPKGYSDIEDFYADVSLATYYTKRVEKEARDEGAIFASKFFQKISERKLRHFLLLKDLPNEKQNFENIQKEQNETYVHSIDVIDSFSELTNVNEEELLKIVEKIESEKGELKSLRWDDSYFSALCFLIKNKTLEQKQSLLKNAIFNSYSVLTKAIMVSMQKDLDFQANKNQISTFIRDCLIGDAFGNSDFELSEKMSRLGYRNLLNPDDYVKVIEKLILKNSSMAADFVGEIASFNFEDREKRYNYKFSLESILKFQDYTFRKDVLDEDVFFYDEKFFQYLFECLKDEEKILYLKSGKLKPEVVEILVREISIGKSEKEVKEILAGLNSANPSNEEQIPSGSQLGE